jgi:inorganic triphosphatase YgiF
MKDEIEIKLDLAPAIMDRLRRHPLIRAHRLGRATTQTLDNTYFDTPDLALEARGAALRIRRSGRLRVQTVKLRNGAMAGHFDRKEWEAPVDGDTPDPDLLAETPLPALLGEDGLAALRPVFVTRFRRTTYRLAETPEAADRGWAIDLTLDSGAVEAADRSTPLVEAELELVRGTPADLYRLARGLVEGLPAHLGTRSKAARGYDLLRGASSTAPKAFRPPLRKAMAPTDAVQAIGRTCLSHYLAAETVLHQTRAPEGIHQMRVALRRLRSALTLFGPLVDTAEGKRLKAEIKWLAGELGDARDRDVFLAEVLAPAAAEWPNDSGLAALGHHMEALREAGYRRALAAVTDGRAMALILDLAIWLEAGDWLSPDHRPSASERPLGEVARDILDRRAQKVVKAGRHFRRLDADHRHRLRIEVKKLRYAVDFFRPLFKDKAGKAYQKALAGVQDTLGGLNDLAVAHRLLQHLTVDEPPHAGRAARDMAFAAGLLYGWHAGRAALAGQAEAEWKRFLEAAPFWR